MPRKKKNIAPVDPNTVDRQTIIFYRGRHTALPKSHFYIVKDTNKEVAFKKKLSPSHKIGLGYPCEVTMEGRRYAVSGRNAINEIEVWENKHEVAQWLKDDETVAKENKRISEQAELRSRARSLAQKIKDEYKRANSLGKRDIIAGFIEELES